MSKIGFLDKKGNLYGPIEGEIENNGWIRVQSENDLPKDFELNNFVACGFFDRQFIGFVDIESDEVYILDNDFEVIKSNVIQVNSWLPRQITHYKPIIKPKPPIF